MYPVLFKIGTFEVHTFGVVMILAFLVGLFIARKRAPKFGINPNRLTDMAFWTLIAGVLGARILFLIQEPPKDWHEILSLKFAGLTSFGGLIGAAAVVLYWCRKHQMSARAVLDAIGPALLVGHAIGRFGCLMNGCCFGGVCPHDLPWGIHIAGSDLLFHPAQIYDSLMNLGAFGLVLLVERKGLQSGQAFALALGLHGVSRFIYEFWRAGTPAQVNNGLASSTYWGSLPITQAQAAAGAMILLSLGMYLFYARRRHIQEPIPA